jgi:hypothetical protein
MRAVWSYWSKPYVQSRGYSWRSHLHHWLAWGLSLRLASEHYPETMLVTDRAGKALLVDSLGLSFTHISTELESLRNVDPSWWALGKLMAYSMQQEPFVHLDTDVFLWKPLPSDMMNASLFAQSPEQHSTLVEWCAPRQIECAFAQYDLSLPAEWEFTRSRSLESYPEANCGILGGNRTDFIRYYADLAMDLVMNSAYARAWAVLSNKHNLNTIIEQFLFAACFEFHRSHPESPFRGMNIRYLFSSTGEALDPESAARAGFTHLWADAKRDSIIAHRLEQRTRDEDAHYYRHCLHLSRNSNFMAAIGA